MWVPPNTPLNIAATALMKPEYNIASGGLVFTSKEKQAQFVIARAQKTSKPIICLDDGSIYPSIRAAALAHGVAKPSISSICERGGISKNGLSFAFFTRPMTEEERQKIISERHAQKRASERARIKKIIDVNSREVTSLNTGKIYLNAGVAEKATKIARGTVSYLCITGNINRNGFCFAFGALTEDERLIALKNAEDKDRQTKQEWKKNLSKMRSRVAPKRVRCDTYGTTFSRAEAAAMEYCILAQSIREVCNGKSSNVYGLKFSYIDIRQ